jgi:hypothetical protein
MTQWEYFEIHASYGDFITLAPPQRVNIEWLIQKYPKVKSEYDKLHHREILKFKQYEEVWEAYHLLIDHLGSQGWEPFATTVLQDNIRYLFFRRPK